MASTNVPISDFPGNSRAMEGRNFLVGNLLKPGTLLLLREAGKDSREVILEVVASTTVPISDFPGNSRAMEGRNFLVGNDSRKSTKTWYVTTTKRGWKG